MITLTKDNDRIILIREVCISYTECMIMDGELYRIIFQVKEYFHFKPVNIEEFIHVYLCSDETTLSFFIKLEDMVLPLTVIKQIIDFIAILILDPYNISYLCIRIKR
ncbi:MAG: hypothetical protein LBT43_15870 [Prevotella sp.]|nr:hypothetical protein [Prevotella sp.]